jgi:sugar/nucleoside kinase (ribokinase family)
MEKIKQDLDQLREKLAAVSGKKIKMLVGVDGFVDEILHLVDTRQDFEHYTRVLTIADLGQRIVKAAGLSTNIEMVPMQIKLGGNGPIFANALLEYGVELTYVGALGKPDVHPVFKAMADQCAAVHSISDPGYTNALEFEDGKLMMGKIQSLNESTWPAFRDALGGAAKIAEDIKALRLFGMENWTMVPHMDALWEGMIREVFPLLGDMPERPIAFFDLADPEKRTQADVLKAMALIGQFQQKFQAVLGLNEKELFEIADVYGIPYDKSQAREALLRETSKAVYGKLGIHCLVVHPTKEALAWVGEQYFHTFGPFCEKPVLTTGAGDNFNAGFSLGLALGLDPQGALLLGVATSGYYVRHAKSPTLPNVQQFLADWQAGRV